LIVRIPKESPTINESSGVGGGHWLIVVRSSGDILPPSVLALTDLSRHDDAVRLPPDSMRNAPTTTNRPAVRLCLAADVERYSRFNDAEAWRAQARFIEALSDARAHAGLTESDVDLQESGDGQFAVLPPGLDESVVIPNLVAGLSIALRHTNADLNEHARLRLRVALHRGMLKPGVNGWIGNSAIAVNRLLDSAPLRTALAQEPSADFALIVSNTLYRDVIAHGYHGLAPELFRESTVDIPAKRFTEKAWIHLGIHRTR
jgi:class 3 adenylate cyclase